LQLAGETFMTGIRLGYVGAASLLTAMLMAATGARAYTPEQQQACSGDAFRLCSQEIPDVDRVTACMARNKSQLSPQCRAQFGPAPREMVADAPAGRPLSIHPAKPAKPAKKSAKRSAKAKAHKTMKSAKS
jgi:hypothetical protein